MDNQYGLLLQADCELDLFVLVGLMPLMIDSILMAIVFIFALILSYGPLESIRLSPGFQLKLSIKVLLIQ